MELREALSQIAEIRARVAASEPFRGYRAVPVGFAGAVAVLAAAVQPYLVPDPAADLRGYLALWVTAAASGIAAAGARILFRDWFGGHSLSREVTRLAVGQFAPCLVAGAVVTLVVARRAPEIAWVLPGMWQVVFSLGVFASCRLLPSAVVWVGVWYLLTGAYNFAFSQGHSAFGPWAMGLPFGVGQLAAAAILYWNLEREAGDGGSR